MIKLSFKLIILILYISKELFRMSQTYKLPVPQLVALLPFKIFKQRAFQATISLKILKTHFIIDNFLNLIATVNVPKLCNLHFLF